MRNTGARPDLPALWLPRYRARGGAERSDLLLRPLRACRWTDRAERSRLTGRFLQRLSQGKIYPATPGQGMAPVGQWRYPVKRKP